jgi:hypothetical protein
MNQYTIITNHYEGIGGKYTLNPKKVPYVVNYQYNERQDFLDRWEYMLEKDRYFDTPKCFFTSFTMMEVIDLTDKLEELKNRI